MKNNIPIVIPSYEPDERLLNLIDELIIKDFFIIVVDDGSGSDFQNIFDTVENKLASNGTVLHHDINKGKGRALKTAFEYVLNNLPSVIGVVTADSDGQHTVSAIESVMNALQAHERTLIIGARSFDESGIPWKSRVGNNLTRKVFKYVTGTEVTDTQTGLRGIPAELFGMMLNIKGERFEYETEMLVAVATRESIVEVPIETIYDSEDNHQTHFNPLVDSIKIYKVLAKQFVRFVIASLSSSIVDLLLFSLFCYLFRNENNILYVTVSTVLARIFSGIYNYLINYKAVFKSNESVPKSAFKYTMLAIIQMLCSAALTTIGVKLIYFVPEVAVKAIVDIFLFFISYVIQQRIVFKK